MNPLSTHRIGVKVFAEPSPNFRLELAVQVFHSWIQKASLGHLLIDVASYEHVDDGPGVLIIAHEGHYALDRAFGQLGMSFVRKREHPGTPAQRLSDGLLEQDARV